MEEQLSKRLSGTLILAALALAAFAWLVLRPLAPALVTAALVAVIYQPVHRRLERRLGSGSVRSATVSTVLLGLILLLPAGGLIVLFLAQARTVLLELLGEEEASSRLVQLLQQLLDATSRLASAASGGAVEGGELAQRALYAAGAALSARLPDLLAAVGRLGLGLLVLSVVLFFLLLRGRQLVELLVELSPLSEQQSRRALRRLTQTVHGVFVGAVATALVQGALGAIGFALTGFSSFLVWGFLISLASFVPFFGTALVWGPVVVYLLADGQTGTALAVLGVGVVVSTVDNLVRPLFIRTRAPVHPLLIFLSLLGGLATFGPMGLLYGPLLAAAVTEALGLYREEMARRRTDGTPPPAPP